jgi:hypothetical protein
MRSPLLLGISLLLAHSQAAPAFKPRPWETYRTILWMGESPWKHSENEDLVFQRLEELGINSGMVTGAEKPTRYVTRRMPYYVENIVNKGLCLKWSSNVKDWNAFITDWSKTGRKKEAFVREYCFDDPTWLNWAKGKMTEAVQVQFPYEPLLYDIRDELSVTMSANPFDYDFSPLALEGFRKWLQQQYPSLDQLNTQWETKFTNWSEVMPFSTDEIKNRQSGGGALPRGNPDWQALAKTSFDFSKATQDRTRWNFAPWCDHRSYMDHSLAVTLDALRQTAHAIDPHTPVGIEGTQMPSAFGGYDLWRLSQVLDWVEPYDIGNARDIFGSFMPGKIFLSTVGESDGNAARRRLWHLLLEGDRGCIQWWSEDTIDWSKPDYPLTAKGRALSTVFKELTAPTAALWLKAEREFDAIDVLYSQSSLQVGWLLESNVDGSTWQRRFSSYEAQHNRMAQVRDGWWKGVQDLGYSPRFVSTSQLTSTWKPKPGGVLILPQCIALSDAEISAIKAAQSAGTVVLMNPESGVFDAHGSLRKQAPWPNEGIPLTLAQSYPQDRMKGKGQEFLQSLAREIKHARSIVPVTGSHLRIYRHLLPSAKLLAIERGISYTMSEALTQSGGNESMETPLPTTLTIPAGYCYDLQDGKLLGENSISLTINPWRPTLLAIFPKPVADPLAALGIQP